MPAGSPTGVKLQNLPPNILKTLIYELQTEMEFWGLPPITMLFVLIVLYITNI